MPTTDELAARLDRLEDRVSALEDRLMQETLRPVRAEAGSRRTTYVSMFDLQEKT